jgi:hypothetical protein
MFKKVELFANVAIIVVALLIGVVLVKRYLLAPSKPTPPVAMQIQPGTKISLPGVEWEKSEQTLLLVLSDTCHFCTESADFYQRLAKQKSGLDSVRLIAVLPQEVNQGQIYLNKLGVAVDEVRQSPLGAIGVSGTPTLLLVDNKGAVKQSWLGKLPPDKEDEVLSQFPVRRSAAR